MFKLLIADDEKLEREALKFIISKSIDSIASIEEAVNGREAIAKVQASKPDIIILDINMPGINGIDAAWKIREKDDSVCIIFLTAFHQFDYAHEAIKVGVEDYIVKPSSEKRIIDVMEKVTGKLLEKKTALRERENMEIRLDRATDYLSSEFIYNLATRNMKEDKFQNYLTLLDMEFFRGRGAIMKLNYETYPILVSSDYQKQILKKRAIRLMKNILMQNNLSVASNMDLNNIFILIFSYETNERLESSEKFEIINTSVTEIIKKNLNIDVTFGMGPLFERAEKAVNSFTIAKKSFSEKNNTASSGLSAEDLPLELEMDLEQAIISADRETTENLFQKIEIWMQISSISFEKKKNAMKDLSAILRHAAASQFPDGNCSVITSDIVEADSILELQTALKVFLNELIDMITSLFARENIPSVKKACLFIKENYHRDLSLEETANHCNLSTFYFSKIFKENKKQNFINYLTELRINEAMRLLKETDASMKEISSKIGYRDPNYFTRVFKRVVNCSPSDYRNNKMLKSQ
jgi:two-component system, response regulator YesN